MVRTLLIACLISYLCIHCKGKNEIIISVTGRVDADSIGIALPHEHIMVDFIGADSIGPGRFNADTVIQTALPYLNDLKSFKGQTLFECTPDYLGRDVSLLATLSKATGLIIVTNTGYYGAVRHKYLPKHVRTDSPQELADRWINEFRNGINGTNIKPGFVKLSVDKGPLSDLQKKIVQAGAITWQQTGLTIAVHSGDGNAARQELDILTTNKVPADAFIWVHAQDERDFNVFTEIAGKGAWVEFDGLSDDNVDQYVSFLKFMKDKSLLRRTLISHDAGYYTVGEKNGGTFRSYTTLFNKLIPRLINEGFNESDIDLLIRTNPAKAYSISE